MELFLPGLFILVITAFFAFLVVPRLGPTILVIVSLIALLAAGVHHVNLFYSEYRLSTWQVGITSAAPWIVLSVAILFILAALFTVFSKRLTGNANANANQTPMQTLQNAVTNSAAATPSAASATNPVTSAINTTLTTIGNTASNTVNAITGNNKKNNSAGLFGMSNNKKNNGGLFGSSNNKKNNSAGLFGTSNNKKNNSYLGYPASRV
uniref:Uncharacterized protein n=1 Tax=viral metagenome TaxID=1070528 RepID=A0A6C0DPE8_9ZZZZ